MTKRCRCFTFIAVTCIPFAHLATAANDATMIARPSDGITIAAADYGFYNFHDIADCQLPSTSERARKHIDLSSLTKAQWQALTAAKVNIFMHVADHQGDGLDETFDIVINGNVNTFPTKDLVKSGVGWFGNYMASGWFGFDISRDQLVHGHNVITLQKSPDATDEDDVPMIGIDIFENRDASEVSFDGGATWQNGPLNRVLARVGHPHYGHHGELMIRLTLYDDPALAHDVPVNHDDLPPLPPIDLNPPVTPLDSPPPDEPATFEAGSSRDVLENGWMRIELSHDAGLAVEALHHKPVGSDLLASVDRSPLFALEIDGRRLPSGSLSVRHREESFVEAPRQKVVYFLEDESSGVQVNCSLTLGSDEELQAGLYLLNASEEVRKIKVAFPLLSGIGWTPDFADDRYLFPYSVGVLGDRPAKFVSPYGGGTGSGGSYNQQMISFSPTAGGALYLRANDPSGGYKIQHLTRTDPSGREPAYSFQGIVHNLLYNQASPGMVFLEPLPKTPGTSLAFSYVQRDLEPNERWLLPRSVIGLCNGDWHQAMNAYRGWYESWSHKRPHPNKLTSKFNAEGISPVFHYHSEEGYNTDIRRPGHLPLVHLEPEYWTENTPDVLEHTAYWESDEVTDEYLEEMRGIAARHGKEFVLWPGRHYHLEGKHVYREGRKGDYGLTGYNESWGGLSAFRQYLNDVKSKDLLATLYINEGEAGLNSIIGRKHGPEWCVMPSPEDYYWPYWMWEMCIENPEWRRYLADTCQRLIAETGADGIRIDEFGGASRICHSPHHPHPFSRPGHYSVFQAQAEASREIRQAMDQVDPSAILMTESPGIDVMWQYMDGALSYDLSTAAPTAGRAGNWEGFVGINFCRYYFPRYKFFDYTYSKHPEWRLFNGTGAYNRERFYSNHQLQIMKENSDAFGSLDPQPLIPTLQRMVYVNKFPGPDKTIYTVYNARHDPVEGDLFDIEHEEGYHFVDLLSGRNVDATERNGRTAISLDMQPRAVACIAKLPKLIEFIPDESRLIISLARPLHDGSGMILVQGDKPYWKFKVEGDRYAATWPTYKRKPLFVKIYEAGRLVDAVMTER